MANGLHTTATQRNRHFMEAAPAIVPTPAPAGRLLLVDDEENILRSIKRVLRRGNWDIQTATEGEQALALIQTFKPQVVISDFRMPGMNGVELLARVKQELPRSQRIMLTGQADQHAVEEAINRSEIYRFIAKPWDDVQLVLTVKSAFDQVALQEENARLYELTQATNDELRQLNMELEARVAQRTQMLSVAKREWEKSFDSIHDPLAIVRMDNFEIVRANLAYAKAAGHLVTEAARKNCHAFLFGGNAPCGGCALEEARRTGTEARTELKVKGRTWEVNIYPMVEDGLAVCSYRDVTDQRELTRRMVDAEKMAAVGQLAGGVAHEINNPLGGILAFAQLMQRDEGRSKDDLESLSLIEESAMRCKRIVESLLKVSRKSREDERRILDLNKSVEDSALLFQARLKSAPRAKLSLKLSAEPVMVEADAGQVAQVLLNLLTNALQALPGEEGTVTVTTGTGREGAFFSVSDTGVGMDESVRAHIFEPLFTTKAPGVGTGLGLSIAYRIVEDHGGKFTVVSQPQQGATFTVSLPPHPAPQPRS